MCLVAQLCLTVAPWTITRLAPLSMEFSRQEYCSGLPFPASGDRPDPGVEPASLSLQDWLVGFFTTSATWKSLLNHAGCLFCTLSFIYFYQLIFSFPASVGIFKKIQICVMILLNFLKVKIIERLSRFDKLVSSLSTC